MVVVEVVVAWFFKWLLLLLLLWMLKWLLMCCLVDGFDVVVVIDVEVVEDVSGCVVVVEVR